MDTERLDLRTYEQASFSISATVYQNDGVTPLNLTGYTGQMRIMDRRDGDVIATLTSGSGITTGGSAGTITVSQTAAQVQAWGLSKGAYDLTISSTGATSLVMYGDLTVVAT